MLWIASEVACLGGGGFPKRLRLDSLFLTHDGAGSSSNVTFKEHYRIKGGPRRERVFATWTRGGNEKNNLRYHACVQVGKKLFLTAAKPSGPRTVKVVLVVLVVVGGTSLIDPCGLLFSAYLPPIY